MKNISKIVTPILFLFLTTTFSSAQQYSTSFEEGVFRDLEEGKTNSYDLLHAIDYDEGLYSKGKRQIDELVNGLKAKNLEKKPLKKQIQIIYKTTHARFLKKYEEKAFFHSIFENGNYNCVSASALFALVFDRFNINYSIKETPAHVYVIADTMGLQTLIETTLPGKGAVSFNEGFKKDFISYLNKNKIISDNEYNHFTTDELFRKYYSKDKSISKVELAAIQYYNKGIFLMQEEKYSGAVVFLDKAQKVYPSNTIKYSHFAALQNALSDDYNKKRYDARLMGQLIKARESDSSLVQLAMDYFRNISVELCINAPDTVRYNNYYKEIRTACQDRVPEGISFMYHYYNGYNYAANGDYRLALSEVKKAWLVNPDNIMVKELANEIGVKYLFVESRYQEQIDNMEYCFNELPFLLDNKLFQQQYVYYYMKVVSNSFMYNGPKEGKAYYERFIKAVGERNIKHYSEEHISIGFGNMALYYASKGDFNKAGRVVDKGLELSPESLQLKQLKKNILDARHAEIRYSNRRESEVVFHDNSYDPAEQLKADVNKNFHGKWRAVSIIMEDMEQKLTQKESFEFVAQKNKNCTFTQNGKTEKGKWSYRMRSRCIYFVPDYDKDAYKVFKVKEAGPGRIVLLPYKDQRTPSPYKYVLKPSS